MPYANRNDQAASENRYYQRNKEAIKEKARIRLSEFRDKIISIKEQNPCIDCGIKYPYYIMEFDHLRDKKHEVSEMVSYSWKRVLEEISKCEIVCANCHSSRTHLRKHPSCGEPVTRQPHKLEIGSATLPGSTNVGVV